jgi:hypothetical protein
MNDYCGCILLSSDIALKKREKRKLEKTNSRSLTKIKNRRKVQDLIDAYISKSRFVWKTVEFFLGGKNIFHKISPR